MRIGRVFKIIPVEGNECYVGSTFNTVRDTFSKCRFSFIYSSDKISGDKQLFSKYGVDGCKAILIKEYNVIDRVHLEVYEKLWIHKLKAVGGKESLVEGLKKVCEVKLKKIEETRLAELTKAERDGLAKIREKEESKVAEAGVFVQWFSETYEYVDDEIEFVKIIDLYKKFKESDLFTNAKRLLTKKKMVDDFSKAESLRPYYRKRKWIRGKDHNNILLKHRLRYQT